MFVLASASPRRQELLRQIGCRFRVVTSDVQEEKGNDSSPEELVLCNARLKAGQVALLAEGLPVLGADTVVSVDGHIYGKPENAEDARRMLRLLSGRSHSVSTGIVFVRGGIFWEAVETTKVVFASLTEELISWYVDTGESVDKAGAYAVQGKAAVFIKRIEGSYSNVVGLPLYRTVKLAKKAGVELYDNYGKRSS